MDALKHLQTRPLACAVVMLCGLHPLHSLQHTSVIHSLKSLMVREIEALLEWIN